ncbi:MAG: aldo/keto reductase [Clostridiales bacterium]|jgi:aryl-alcohol dehydrogenase-like predicted oxidoreductase|nr:aldo/keto reductase [Clostridiales bacterium]
MAGISIGRTGINVERNAFGVLPAQRIPLKEAAYLLKKAYDGGMGYFDTARAYTDSEDKLNAAFSGMREKVVIATKSGARTGQGVLDDLHESLKRLGTDYIDVYQPHNPPFCPRPGDESGIYDVLLKAKEQGKIRVIGITNHRLDVATEAVDSGLYETLQFPLSYLSGEKELALAKSCEEKNVGFIAMKALSGGLITNAKAACAWIMRTNNVVPIWGIQRESELDEFLGYIQNPPELDKELEELIEADRIALDGEFCRGCGYCCPCPQGIVIHMAARASLLLRRAPLSMMLSENGRNIMKQAEKCTGCGLCKTKCPYGLDTPALLKKNCQDYREVLAGKPM